MSQVDGEERVRHQIQYRREGSLADIDRPAPGRTLTEVVQQLVDLLPAEIFGHLELLPGEHLHRARSPEALPLGGGRQPRHGVLVMVPSPGYVGDRPAGQRVVVLLENLPGRFAWGDHHGSDGPEPQGHHGTVFPGELGQGSVGHSAEVEDVPEQGERPRARREAAAPLPPEVAEEQVDAYEQQTKESECSRKLH